MGDPATKGSTAKIVHPPQKIPESKTREWLEAEINATCPGLPYEIIDTETWAHYVNHDHFVPLTIEGVPEDFRFNYSWIADKDKRQRLPSAEVIETGKFVYWGDRCNFYELDEKECRDFIKLVVRHESRHFAQWQSIAIKVLTTLGYKVDPKKLPKTLEEIEKYPGAKEAFMRIWANGAHYQCREVEVYTKQIENGEIPKDDLFMKRLQGLYVYTYGNEHSPGCANSIWAPEFSDFIERAEKLFKENGISGDNKELF